MVDVYSKGIESKVNATRILGHINGSKPGPTVVFFGGIHGNETSGVVALLDVFKNIDSKHLTGTIYGISGNLKALHLNQRYVDEDLNRLWTKERIEAINKKELLNTEESQLVELLSVLTNILKTEEPPFYFIDLHTTSSKTLPFITINDALINRKFSKQFPVPIVLGIEEYLNGPLLSYINQLGYVSLGFESGQHDDLRAITNNVAFIYLTLVFSGVLRKEEVIGFSTYYKVLQAEAVNITDVYEVIYLYRIQHGGNFKMLNGFRSFQFIKKGTPLAISNMKEIKAKYTGIMFMPLYQKRGAEGFFIIKTIKPFYLKLSTLLRRIKIDRLLVWLPGISWDNKEKQTLKVNLKIAKFFAKSFFHLMGYRNKQLTKTHLRLNNRERTAKTGMYKRENWFKKR